MLQVINEDLVLDIEDIHSVSLSQNKGKNGWIVIFKSRPDAVVIYNRKTVDALLGLIK